METQQMKGEEAMEIFKLVKARNLLPEKLTDLVPLSFIGQAAVSFYRTKIKVMDQLKMTEEQRRITLRDGQDAGEMLLDIETRIGELIDKSKPTEVKHDNFGRFRPERFVPDGMPKHRSAQAQMIAKHPEIVERVKAQARENEDIPTKTAVLSEIKYQKEKERRENAPPKSKTELSGEEFKYQQALIEVISILPQEPPKHLTEQGFKVISALAKTIIKRLRRFENGQA